MSSGKYSRFFEEKWGSPLKNSLDTRKSNNDSYNEDKIPPDWHLAEDHRSSRSVGIEKEFEKGEHVNVCDCCGYQVERKPLDLCCSLDTLGFLGTGYPLFFYFIIYLIIVLFALLLSSGGYNIISNYHGSFCVPASDLKSSVLEDMRNITRLKSTPIARPLDYSSLQTHFNSTIESMNTSNSSIGSITSNTGKASNESSSSNTNLLGAKKYIVNRKNKYFHPKKSLQTYNSSTLSADIFKALWSLDSPSVASSSKISWSESSPQNLPKESSPQNSPPAQNASLAQNTSVANSSNNPTINQASNLSKNNLVHINNKADQYCQLNWIMMLSLPNKKNSPTLKKYQEYTNLGSVVLFVLLFHWWRWKMRVVNVKCDTNDLQASDYTIQIKNIPTNLEINYTKELKSFLERMLFKDRRAKIERISLGFDLDKQLALETRKKEIIKEKKKELLSQQKKNSEITKEDRDRLENIENRIAFEENKLEELEANIAGGWSDTFAGWAFVSFKTKEEKERAIANHKITTTNKIKMFFYKLRNAENPLVFHGNQLIIEQAPEPTDIVWENLKFTDKQKLQRRLVGYSIMFLTILLAAIIIFGLLFAQQGIKKEEKEQERDKMKMESSSTVKILGLLVAIAIPIVNLILVACIENVASYEKYSTKTEYFLKIVANVSFAQFINTAVLTFLINLLYIRNLYGPDGLIFNQNMVFISNIMIPIGMHGSFPLGIVKNISIWWERRKNEKSVLTQAEAHTLYEKPAHNMAVSLGELMKNMLFTAFYAPILPLGIVWTVLGTIMLYWIHKYNVLRRVTVKYNLGMKLIMEATELLEFFLILFSTTNLVFDYLIFDSISNIQIITLGIALLNAILPMQHINELLFKVKEQDTIAKDYSDAYKDFDTDYERENPATREESTERYRKQMEVPRDIITCFEPLIKSLIFFS